MFNCLIMIRIHKEGRIILLTILAFLVAINLLIVSLSSNNLVSGLTLIASLMFYLAVVSFFRNPVRDFNLNSDALISPADGKIVVIEEVDEPEYFKDRRIQVSIFMSVYNVHVNRWPANGIVKYYKHHSGRFHAAFLPKASTENERSTVVLSCKPNFEFMIRQIAGAMARRIVTYVTEGQNAEQIKDMGFIKFGSRVDLLLPIDATILVNVGDKVKGGITPIADINCN